MYVKINYEIRFKYVKLLCWVNINSIYKIKIRVNVYDLCKYVDMA